MRRNERNKERVKEREGKVDSMNATKEMTFS